MRSWKVLSREPSGDRIARSCRHTAPDLTVNTEVKDRIAKSLLSQHVLGFRGPFKPWMYELKSSKNKHRIAKQILRQCCCLSQRSRRLSRDRRQPSSPKPTIAERTVLGASSYLFRSEAEINGRKLRQKGKWTGKTENYLTPLPRTILKLKTQENHIYHSLRRIGQSLGATVVVDSSGLSNEGKRKKKTDENEGNMKVTPIGRPE